MIFVYKSNTRALHVAWHSRYMLKGSSHRIVLQIKEVLLSIPATDHYIVSQSHFHNILQIDYRFQPKLVKVRRKSGQQSRIQFEVVQLQTIVTTDYSEPVCDNLQPLQRCDIVTVHCDNVTEQHNDSVTV